MIIENIVIKYFSLLTLMETTRNELPYKLKRFLDKMKTDLDTQFYYYGSVQRNDYIAGKSDIDICIFTDNETSMITRVAHFLRVPKTDFKKMIIINDDDTIYGHKIKYTTNQTNDKNEPFVCEFSIYNNKFKSYLMDFYHKSNNVPVFILILLYILKKMFYIFPVMSKKRYNKIKDYIFTKMYLKFKKRSFFLLD